MRRFIFLALVLPLLSGCLYGKDYGCEGHPDGVNCMSAREVYRLTDTKEALAPEDANNPKEKKKQNPQPQAQAAAVNAPGNPVVDPATAAVQGLYYEGPIPLRTSAQVMRIWVAPWESMDGALHLPSYLYVEVVERKWSVGEAKMEMAPQITPLQVEAPQATAAPSRPSRPQVKQDKRPPQQGPQQKPPGAAGRPPVPEKSKAIPPQAGFPPQLGQDKRQNLLLETD
jgi:conjugal transfer pilus assembly protein TraV